MEYTFERAGWRDFPALKKLQQQIARETEHMAVTRSDRSDSLLYTLAKAVLNRNRVHAFVAKDEEKIVGYITIICGKFLKVRGTAYIVMGVLASHRGKGIGTELLKRAEELVRGKNMHRIELEVFENNANAIHLYEKMGYIAEGRRREAIKTTDGYEDIIWMGKLLEGNMSTIAASPSLKKTVPTKVF
jgi:RimJ/RimL family protein N-acetyltransferase